MDNDFTSFFENNPRYGNSHWLDDGTVVDEIPRYLPEGFLPFNIPEHAKKAAATGWYRTRISQAQLPSSTIKPNTDVYDIALCERVMGQLRDFVVNHCSKGLFDIFRLSNDDDGQSGYHLFYFDFLAPFLRRLSRLTQIQPPALEIIPCDPKCSRLLFECGQNLVAIAEMVLCSESFAFQTADRFLPCTRKGNVVLKGILFYQARLGAQLLAASLAKFTMNDCLESIRELKKTVATHILIDASSQRENIASGGTIELSPYVCPTLVMPYLDIERCNALHGALAASHFDRLFHLAEMVRSKLVNVLNFAYGGASVKANLLLLDIGIHFHLIFDSRFLDALSQLNAQKVTKEDESDIQAIYPYDPDVLKADNRRRNRIYMKYFVTRQIYSELRKFVTNIIEKRIGLPDKCCPRLRGVTLNEETPECVWQCMSWLVLLITQVCEILNAKDSPTVNISFGRHSSELLHRVISPFVANESLHQASVNVYCNVLTGKLNTLFNY